MLQNTLAVVDILKHQVVLYLNLPVSPTTPDLKYSKVFLSIFPDSKVQDVFNEIRNCIPFIRKTIARKINLRTCPEFHFEIDDSLAYSKKMDDLFAKISKDGNNND